MNVADATADGLSFVEEDHSYWRAGQRVPNVTMILEHAGISDFSGVPRDILQAAKERGTRVHHAVALHDLGLLDEGSVAPDELGYLDAWKRFRREQRYRPKLTEWRVYHTLHQYAGTLDSFGTLRTGRYDSNALIDVKSGVRTAAAGPQTAAYLAALKAPGVRHDTLRFGVYLRADGTYELEQFRNSHHWQVFLAALTAYRYVESWK